VPRQEDDTTGGRDIHQIALSYFKDIEIIIIALVIFLSVFVVIVLWALKRPKKEIEEMANLPLEDDSAESKEDKND
jgi:cbb3-type cytochrome oxidase subunit 3